MPIIDREQERQWAREDAVEKALVAAEGRESGLVSRVAELEAKLAQARRLLRELWDSVDAGVPSIDLMSRVVDELAKERA